MSAEYRYIDGTLRVGYFCANCGQTINMLGSGHFDSDFRNVNEGWTCRTNRKLVEQLRRANPLPGVKPHYILSRTTPFGSSLK